MPPVSVPAAPGWEFLLLRPDGTAQRYSLPALDRHFDLSLRGATWEAAALSARVGYLSGARVEAWFNGSRLAASQA